jgi:Mg-chelatase subunit ChlD
MLYGTLRIPSDQITSITMGGPRGGDSVETASFKVSGEIKDQTFIVDTKLGRLSVGKKDVKTFAVRQLTPEQLAEAAFLGEMRRLNRSGIDLMVVIDTTDTMSGTVKAFVGDAAKLWDFLHKHVPNTQAGVVSYRDTKANNPDEFEYVIKGWPLTSDRDVFLGNVKDLNAKGGGDIPEAVYEGLKEAMENGGWRDDAIRIVILVGDAPPHKENKGMERTLTLVTDWNRKAGGVLHAIDTTGWNKLMYDFIDMAKVGGGESISLHEEKDIVPTMIPLILGAKYRDRLLADLEGKPYPPPAPKPENPETPEAKPDAGTGVITIEQ